MTLPIVQRRYADVIALWPGDERAKVCFSIEGNRVIVTDITRGGLPKGSGGSMVANALRVHGERTQPAHIRAANVLDKEAAFGIDSMAVLTDVIKRAAALLGGTVVATRQGQDLGKRWVEIDVRY